MAVDLRLLTSFVAVAEERSYTKAAARLHLTQQSVSWHVQRLEEELDVQLLQRTTRRVEPTAAGEDLLAGARRILAEVEELTTRVRRYGTGELGEVVVAFSPAVGFEIVPRMTAALEERTPGMRVEWRELWMDELLAAVADGTVDVGVALEPPEAPGLEQVPLTTTTLGIQLARKHALAGRDSLDLSELAGLPLALPDTDASPGVHTALLEACRAAGLDPEIVVLNRSHAAVPDALFEGEAFGAWVTSMPSRYQPSELSVVPLRDAPVLRICLVHQEDHVPAVVRQLVAVALDAIGTSR